MNHRNSPARVMICVGLIATILAGCAHSRDVPKGLLQIEMIDIAGGRFTMGDEFDYEDIDATPVHEVTLADFRLAATEVTFAQYDAFALKNNLSLPGDDALGRGQRAVVNVSWDEAVAFCEAYGFRLPTEEEWEYAARDRGLKRMYAGTNDEAAAKQYVGALDELGRTPATVVGQRLPNDLGLYDMSGNVFEWVADFYPFYPQPEDKPEYADLTTNAMRIIRGGSARNGLAAARTYSRASTLHSIRSSAIGFRCADSE